MKRVLTVTDLLARVRSGERFTFIEDAATTEITTGTEYFKTLQSRLPCAMEVVVYDYVEKVKPIDAVDRKIGVSTAYSIEIFGDRSWNLKDISDRELSTGSDYLMDRVEVKP